jgi:hypothetical protein
MGTATQIPHSPASSIWRLRTTEIVKPDCTPTTNVLSVSRKLSNLSVHDNNTQSPQSVLCSEHSPSDSDDSECLSSVTTETTSDDKNDDSDSDFEIITNTPRFARQHGTDVVTKYVVVESQILEHLLKR